MAYRGIVKNGKIELDPPATLPEGTRVKIALAEDWTEGWRKLAEEIGKATPPGVSIVEELMKSRR